MAVQCRYMWLINVGMGISPLLSPVLYSFTKLKYKWLNRAPLDFSIPCVYPAGLGSTWRRVCPDTVHSSGYMEWTPCIDTSEVIQSFQKLSLSSDEMDVDQNINSELDDAGQAFQRLDLNTEEMEICK